MCLALPFVTCCFCLLIKTYILNQQILPERCIHHILHPRRSRTSSARVFGCLRLCLCLCLCLLFIDFALDRLQSRDFGRLRGRTLCILLTDFTLGRFWDPSLFLLDWFFLLGWRFLPGGLGWRFLLRGGFFRSTHVGEIEELKSVYKTLEPILSCSF